MLGQDVDTLEDNLTWEGFIKWSVYFEQKEAIRQAHARDRDDARDWSQESADAIRAAWGAE